MSALSHAVTDSATMLRRNLRHALRYPSLTLATVGMPIIILLLFVGVLGGTLGAGLGPAVQGGAGYIDYVAPGIILMTVASGSVATSVSVSVDMTGGIINRFRTMAISRASLLTGHVAGSMIQTVVSTAAVIGVAMLMGFRPTAGPPDWIAAIGLLLLLTFALTWLAVLIGLVSKTPNRRATHRSSSGSYRSSAAPSSPWTRCPPVCAGSPRTSPSRPSSRPPADCCWARRSEAARRSRSPGASPSP